jgi:branched-chain amino acid transport system substrate-binding protein
MKKALWIIGLAVLIGAGVFVSKNTKESPDSIRPIKIGSVSALSGVGVPVGEEERNGALLAVLEINARGGVSGRMLELVPEDISIDKLKVAPSVISKLVNIDKVVAIVGAQWDEPSEAIIPSIESLKIPTISPDATSHVEVDKDASYFFSTWYDSRVGIRTILSYAKEQSLKRIYIIRPINGGFWKFTADLITEYAPEYGVEIVGDVDLGNPLTMDFRTPLAKVKSVRPDAIFVVTTDPNQCVLSRQAKELGLTMPILATEAAGNYDSLSKCAHYLETTYFSTPVQSDSYRAFESAYSKMFGRPPQYPSAVNAFDAIYVIAQALDETDGQGGALLRDEIAKTKNMSGASLSKISLDKKGYLVTPSDSFEMKTVRDGKFVKVD